MGLHGFRSDTDLESWRALWPSAATQLPEGYRVYHEENENALHFHRR